MKDNENAISEDGEDTSPDTFILSSALSHPNGWTAEYDLIISGLPEQLIPQAEEWLGAIGELLDATIANQMTKFDEATQ